MESAAAASVEPVAGAEAERSRLSVTAWREDVRHRARGRRSHTTDHPSPLRRWAWFCAIALHLLLIIGLRLTLRPTAPAAADADVMQVDLVDLPSPEPPLPEPVLPLPRPPSEPKQRPPRATSHATARTPAAPAAAPEPAQLRLFNPDGSAMLPDDIAAQLDRARPQPDFIARRYEPSPILAAKRPIKVRPNHFAQYWAGTDGMPLHQALFRQLTVVKEFTAPWGGKYACAWILIVVACGDVPDKPWTPPVTWKPATEFDEQ